MRLRKTLAALLFTGCVVQSPPPRYGYQQQQPNYQQQPPTQQPPTQPLPATQPQPPPEPAPPQPQPPAEPAYYDVPGSFDVNVSVSGDAVWNLDVFFDQLDPYGTWYDDTTYGWVFVPSTANYVPYSNGYWKYTDYGLLWVSNDPFGWATDHYGRWVYLNRWVWAPDLTWGPAWVNWRQGNGWIGWAPAGYQADAYVPENDWHFCRAPDLFAVDLKSRFITGGNKNYLATSNPVIRYNKFKNYQWVAGPSENW